MKLRQGAVCLVSAVLGFFALLPTVANAQQPDCNLCHKELAAEKVLHPAMQRGCQSCHSGIDASAVPHRIEGKNRNGLKAPQKELCLSCHDKDSFSKKVEHPALALGCSTCHSPHSSRNAKLLKSAVPELCTNCHDAANFKGKVAHAPVAAGSCGVCHVAHTSDYAQLLAQPTTSLCLTCHDRIAKAPHVVAGFSGKGHPLGNEKRAQPAKDPLREGQLFSCTSCHQPHKGDLAKLSRFESRSAMGSCQKCHKL